MHGFRERSAAGARRAELRLDDPQGRHRLCQRQRRDLHLHADDNASYEIGLTVSDKDGGSLRSADDQCGRCRPTRRLSISVRCRWKARPSRSRVPRAIRPAARSTRFSYVWTVPQGRRSFCQWQRHDLAFTPDENGSYEIGLTVSDKDGASVEVSQTISVANVAPSPTIVSISEPRVESTAITVRPAQPAIRPACSTRSATPGLSSKAARLCQRQRRDVGVHAERQCQLRNWPDGQ